MKKMIAFSLFLCVSLEKNDNNESAASDYSNENDEGEEKESRIV
jgi:hypothetical protein